MSLPSVDMAWPPTNLAPVWGQYAAWSAWYSGSPEDLASVYGGYGSGLPYDSTSMARLRDHPSQYRGGVVGRLARWFWGEPANLQQRRVHLHVPVAGDIARTSAELLFAEPPKISVPKDAGTLTATQDRIDQLVDDGVHATFIEAAEVGAALGGVYLRVCWDRDVADRPWLAAVHADAAVPEWKWGRLTAVTFWQVLADDGKTVVRHLERHEPGVILNGVYEGTPDRLGKPVDLAAFNETAGLQPVVETELVKLTAEYIPNMRPNRLWRNLPAAAPLGRSDFAGVEPLMDALDETYSSWMRDIRLGKARLIASETAMQNLGQGKGSYVDLDREVYEGLNVLGKPGDMPVTQVQFAIRFAEHRDTAQHYLEQILRGGGYSTQTFGLSGDVAVTATEVSARERSSITTRSRKINYTRPVVASAAQTLLMVDAAVFGSDVEPVLPNVGFGDYVGADMSELGQTAQILRAAEAASTETLVRLVHPDWDDKQVEAEVTKIQNDQAVTMSRLDTPLGLDTVGMG